MNRWGGRSVVPGLFVCVGSLGAFAPVGWARLLVPPFVRPPPGPLSWFISFCRVGIRRLPLLHRVPRTWRDSSSDAQRRQNGILGGL